MPEMREALGKLPVVALCLLIFSIRPLVAQAPQQAYAPDVIPASATGVAPPHLQRSFAGETSTRQVHTAARLTNLPQGATYGPRPGATIAGLPAELPMLPHGGTVLNLVQFDDIPLSEAMRLFAEQSQLNVITSAEAGKTRITVYLKNVTALDALEVIVKANGLFYRIEENSGIVRIATLKEYEKDLASFREEQTRVFTLLYPNPSAVAQVIQQVFGNRVQLSRADADVEDLVDLSRRFSRFDLVDGRSLGLGGANAGHRDWSTRSRCVAPHECRWAIGGSRGPGSNGRRLRWPGDARASDATRCIRSRPGTHCHE